MDIDIRNGLVNCEQYHAWKFPGGELHLKLKINDVSLYSKVNLIVKLNSSDDLMLLFLITDTIRKINNNSKITLWIPYMCYQQADMDINKFESFSLKTISNIINSFNFNKVIIFHPHSNVTSGLINNVEVVNNSTLISFAFNYLLENNHITSKDDLIILTPDAGSYKSVFKSCENLEIQSCSKTRNHNTGEITTIVPTIDDRKVILIIDDMSLGGRTFLNIREKLENEKVFLCVSHGIFNENVDKLEKSFVNVFVSNSRYHDMPVGNNFIVKDLFELINKEDYV